ncbi:MAG TPA: hypothetical protein VFC63_16000 [Blastocatellia bacterium]|nr:hypothetical protein [Blastocatellia bacterium]
MSCQNFELLIIDLARNQIVEATARQSTLAHLDTCAVCAQRFADEKDLTARLRVLAAESGIDRPSQDVEVSLAQVFRLMSKDNAVATDSIVTRRRWKVAAVAAAVLAVAMSLYAFHLHGRPSPGNIATKHENNVETPKKDSTAGAPQPSVEQNLAGVHESRQNPVVKHRHKTNAALTHGTSSTNSETTAEFIMLPTAGNLAPLESGQIVRVEVMRSTLIAIGFPMDAERANESIKADLLLGQDGVARAIRFLQ